MVQWGNFTWKVRYVFEMLAIQAGAGDRSDINKLVKGKSQLETMFF
jgi:hypothetical protein